MRQTPQTFMSEAKTSGRRAGLGISKSSEAKKPGLFKKRDADEPPQPAVRHFRRQ